MNGSDNQQREGYVSPSLHLISAIYESLVNKTAQLLKALVPFPEIGARSSVSVSSGFQQHVIPAPGDLMPILASA